MAEQRDDNYSGVWDGRLGFGKKSALVVIDLLKGYTTEGSPLYAPGVVDACNEAPELIDAARKAGIDIFHTQVRYNEHNFIDGGVWIKKAPVLKCLVESDPLAHFDERVLPGEGETVITKQYASVFFGTSFAATLTAAGIDTLTNIENVIGSDFSDTITGSSGANVLTGGGGDDVIERHVHTGQLQ